MDKCVKIALLGCGNVGSKVINLLQAHYSLIKERAGADIVIKKVLVRDISKKYGVGRVEFTDRFEDILNDPEINIVVEVMGGIDPAFSYIMEAINKKKHIVTANKSLLSEKWEEIFGNANKKEVDVYLEASVGGGIPVIQALHDGLAPDKISKVAGIINGTTNYILTRMEEDGLGFENALREAQEKGYAESDPSFDIDGVDSAQKLSILTAIAFRRYVHYKKITRQSLRDVDILDIENAKKYFNSVIKYLACSESVKDGSGINLTVAPFIIENNHPLASVRENYNSIFIEGDYCKKTMFFGEGAGGKPTANAVMSDIIYISRNIARGVDGKVPSIVLPADKNDSVPDNEKPYKYYLRLPDIGGSFSSIIDNLHKYNIAIEFLLREGSEDTIIKTASCRLADLRETLKIFEKKWDFKILRFYQS